MIMPALRKRIRVNTTRTASLSSPYSATSSASSGAP